MPFISNIPRFCVPLAHHYDPGCNSTLISINDVGDEPPIPKFPFRNIHAFYFLDLDNSNIAGDPELEAVAINKEQGAAIATILRTALANNTNVIVHCTAGVCRSGAIVEAGVRLGFVDAEEYRAPNQRVLAYVLEPLGLTHGYEK